MHFSFIAVALVCAPCHASSVGRIATIIVLTIGAMKIVLCLASHARYFIFTFTIHYMLIAF
jgi:hypothetical protein